MNRYIRLKDVIEVFDFAEREFCECEYAVKNIREAVEQLPATDVKPVRWIPVEERMPETDKLVLVVKSDGDMAVAGWNAALGWLHYWSGFRVRNVTHWMPLPEPPKEE